MYTYVEEMPGHIHVWNIERRIKAVTCMRDFWSRDILALESALLSQGFPAELTDILTISTYCKVHVEAERQLEWLANPDFFREV